MINARYLKRFVAMVLLIGLCVGTLQLPAEAHVLETSNGVSAIMHIKPDDNPMSAKPTAINFLLSQKAGSFSLSKYKLRLVLSADGNKKVETIVPPAYFGASTEAETTVTFPESAVYEVSLIGEPKSADAKPFTLDYTVRVTGGTGLSNQQAKRDGTPIIILSALSLALLVIVAISRIKYGGRYNQPRG